MNCDHAANLINARLDGEIAPADDIALDAHLAGCAACRSTVEWAELQDAALVRAFAIRRDAAATMGERVASRVTSMNHQLTLQSDAPAQVHAGCSAPGSGGEAPGVEGPDRILSISRWAGWFTAAAAGFVAALVLIRPTAPVETVSNWPAPSAELTPVAEPIARLAIASGDIFICPSGETEWKPLSPGDALAAGDKVRTADAAKCELTLPDGSKLRLNVGTELQLAGEREVNLAAGQIGSTVPPAGQPVRFSAGDARIVTETFPAQPTPAQLDVACTPKLATVTVLHGAARVDGQRGAATMQRGETMRIEREGTPGQSGVTSFPVMTCSPTVDTILVTQWLDDLLLLLPGDDPELTARVDALLGRIVVERARQQTRQPSPPLSAPGIIEQHVRSRGEAWARPIARYALRHRSSATEPGVGEKRRLAGRLLADIATPACVPDLVALISDDDAELRRHAAQTLRRLTGKQIGF